MLRTSDSFRSLRSGTAKKFPRAASSVTAKIYPRAASRETAKVYPRAGANARVSPESCDAKTEGSSPKAVTPQRLRAGARLSPVCCEAKGESGEIQVRRRLEPSH